MESRLLISFIGILLSLTVSGQCHLDRHNTSTNTHWISCQRTQNPVPDIGVSNWIMYDFSEDYQIDYIKLWNCNIPDQLDWGVSKYRIDYAGPDFVWTNLGDFTLDKSDGFSRYEGIEEIETKFNAQYVVITVLDTHGSSCCCLAEAKFGTSGIFSNVSDVDHSNELSIYPNPAQSFITIDLNIESNGLGYLSIMNISGKIMEEKQMMLKSGQQLIELPLDDYISGQYVLKIQTETINISQQFSIINDFPDE